MTQYLSVKTENLLERREECFHYKSQVFPGLIDPETNDLYDHPDDSYAHFLGMQTSLERGLIIPVLKQKSKPKWKDQMKSFVDSCKDINNPVLCSY